MNYILVSILCSMSLSIICMEKSDSSTTSETEESSFFSHATAIVINNRTRHMKRSSSTSSIEYNNESYDESYSDKEYNLFCITQDIITIVKNSFQSRQNDQIHPSYRQLHLPEIHKSKMGIYLYFKDDVPAGLFTPWGIWNFWDKKTLQTIQDNRVPTTLIRPHLDIYMNMQYIVAYNKLSKIMADTHIPNNKYSFGPIFKIKTIKDVNLNKKYKIESVFCNKKKRWIDQQKTWNAMRKRYTQEQSTIELQEKNSHTNLIKTKNRPRSKSSPRDGSPKRIARKKENPRLLEGSPRTKGSPRAWFNALFRDHSLQKDKND